MKKRSQIMVVMAAVLFASNMAHAAVVDTIEAPTANFGTYLGPTEDWSWSHNALTQPFTTASLNIAAYDVDYSMGERDEIWALDNGSWTSLGYLGGANNQWEWTTFALGANFFDDIAAGLQVKLDISKGSGSWWVTLAKSSLATDGAALPNPSPSPVPVPVAIWLFGTGLLAFLGMAKRKARA